MTKLPANAPPPPCPGAKITLHRAPPVKQGEGGKRARFILIPIEWHEGLTGAHGAAQDLGRELLLEAWRKDVKTVSVSNILARRVGVSPRHKTRVLGQLEERGLVKVERYNGRAPRATLLEVLSPPEIESDAVAATLPDSPPARSLLGADEAAPDRPEPAQPAPAPAVHDDPPARPCRMKARLLTSTMLCRPSIAAATFDI
jgi:hypothetical protein